MESGLMRSLAPIAAGFLLDLALGDPEWLYHPVRLIGRLINRMEALLRGVFPSTPRGELAAGGLLAVSAPAVCYGIARGLLWGARLVHPGVEVGLEILFCYQILAARSLWKETMRVCRPLEEGNLQEARKAVSRVVGRDTGGLDEAGVARAAVETVAENTTDGVVAPLLFLFLGGSGLGWCYKAVNTLDSMVGYRNETYRYFGRASARLDDLLNWVPARIAAGCMLLGSLGKPFDCRRAWRVYRRDRRAHASPNSAQTEAVCAGALGIQLGGGGRYGGKWIAKPTIGDPVRPVEARDIALANRLMLRTAVVAFVLLFAAKGILGKVGWGM